MGAPLLVVAFFYTQSPLVILMALLALPHVWSAIKGLRPGSDDLQASADYYQAALETKLKYGAGYLALAVFLAAISNSLHLELSSFR